MTNDYSTDADVIENAISAVYIKKSSIADNLSTNDSTKVLSAKQGKLINDKIGVAITYINL